MRRPCLVAGIGAASAKRGAKRRKGRKNSIVVVRLSLMSSDTLSGSQVVGGRRLRIHKSRRAGRCKERGQLAGRDVCGRRKGRARL